MGSCPFPAVCMLQILVLTLFRLKGTLICRYMRNYSKCDAALMFQGEFHVENCSIRVEDVPALFGPRLL